VTTGVDLQSLLKITLQRGNVLKGSFIFGPTPFVLDHGSRSIK